MASSPNQLELPPQPGRSISADYTQPPPQHDTTTGTGGSRAPSRAFRRQVYTPSPNFSTRPRTQSRFGNSRPGTSMGRRRSGDLVQMQKEGDAIQTFLRIRPPPEDAETDENDPYPAYLRVMNKSELLLLPPEDDLKARNRVPEQFGFAQVFPYDAGQENLFRNTTMPLVQDLLKRGRDALVFAYGVTNSGKTYTVQGERTDPGVLPRSLHVLFSTIEDRISDLKMRPVRFCEVEMCDDLNADGAEALIREAAQQAQPKPKRNARKEPAITVGNLASDVAASGALEPEQVPVDDRYRYSVWVSFAEIYTEKAYDLLSNTVTTATTRRKNLIITHCPATGAKYMHGLREVHVSTIEEAYAVLELGQRNRTVFSTLLNQTSSRSHSIFTVKLLKIPIDVTEETLLERLDEVAMCRMSIVDLAGQERNKRTHNTGQRLKEAGKVNQSLMVLGQCLEALRHNQANPAKPVVVPYRHSKLTELFQGFFFGEGRAAMIVNLNPFDTNYHETSHVVRFAVAAREVTMNKLEGHHRRRRPTSRSTDLDEDGEYDLYSSLAATTEEDQDEQDEYIESLLAQITELRQKWMEAEARLARREAEIREEMAAEMEAKARQMELAFAERLRRELALKEESMKAAQADARNVDEQADADLHAACREEIDRLRRELEEKLAQLAERDARVSSLQSDLESARVALAEMTQRRETADSLIVSLRDELAHEREQADLARRTALEQTDALHAQLTELQAAYERSQTLAREGDEKLEAEQRRADTLQEELKSSKVETTAERERAESLAKQLELLQAGLDRQREEANEVRQQSALDAQRIQSLLEEMQGLRKEQTSERGRSESVVIQLEDLRQELNRERLLSEEGRRGEAVEASRVQQLLKELQLAQEETRNERQRADQYMEKESTAQQRVQELLKQLEQVKDQLRLETEGCRALTDQLDAVRSELLAEKARSEAMMATSEARIQLLMFEVEKARKEIVTLERTVHTERVRVETMGTERQEVERLRMDELKRLRELLMELERACRETRDVKREREVALTEVDILRERLHRDRNRIKELRRELLSIDQTTPPEEINMSSAELVLELRRAVRAADLERDDYEARIDEYEAAALQHRLERQELLEKNVHMRRVLHKMTMDMASGERPSSSAPATTRENTRDSTRSRPLSTGSDTFFRSLFHRRPKIPDFEVTHAYVESPSQTLAVPSNNGQPDDHASITQTSTTGKRKSGFKRVVSALRGNGTARPQTTLSLRRLSKALRRRGRKSVIAVDERERSPSPIDDHPFFNDEDDGVEADNEAKPASTLLHPGSIARTGRRASSIAAASIHGSAHGQGNSEPTAVGAADVPATYDAIGTEGGNEDSTKLHKHRSIRSTRSQLSATLKKSWLKFN